MQAIRDNRNATPLSRRKAGGRGAVRVPPAQPRQLPRLRLPRPNLRGLGGRLQHLLWPLLLVALGMGLYELGSRLMPLADRPIALISVEGELEYIDREAVQQVIQPYLNDSFLGIDLDGLRSDLLAMPWVAQASVRRVWPDKLVIALDEQLPVARWGDKALLNNEGKAFEPQDIARFSELPQLNGPERSKRRVMRQYQQFSSLLRPQGMVVSKLELRDRGSWFLTTDDGMELLLGRDNLVDKMQRFMTIEQLMLSDRRELIARVDLRYSNGMAVAWRDAGDAEKVSE
ncbi:cell division protein FtsQ [Halopseudomonas oceani]|uniref:Cell division protein FtsQ n=1 Tax=Halopseudomonas oceani TaxID=1708783 RepID=A0A2P4EY96_9GAMM|nr:cell division protein FtsQ/DivIB [Halopseudomonas oceani]POB05193.1 cell division protein FtsQ [Halopseudomonas oceani]GGE33867.1 cell division protein FtsQ [Halopseudomonas oceani]